MSSQPASAPSEQSQIPPTDGAAAAHAGAPQALTSAAPRALTVSRALAYIILGVAAAALIASGMLWQKLSNIQEQLARQSADAGTSAIEARTLARQAHELARENAARQALAETRLAEVALQRSQVEELVQSMSRSRDENMLVDIESALRLAQQQAQATGSVEPLLGALRSADQRLERAGQPRLSRVRAAVLRDTERIKTSNLTDVPGLLARLDEAARQVDELPLANAVPVASASTGAKKAVAAPPVWWQRLLSDIREEVRALVRINRIDQPEAVLLAPDQAFFLKENLKLRLLNARLSLLSRQSGMARDDVLIAGAALRKYFDPSARKTQILAGHLEQVQSQLRSIELPRIDESLAVLVTAAAGR